jgi:hypothetical protein
MRFAILTQAPRTLRDPALHGFGGSARDAWRACRRGFAVAEDT